MLGERSLKISKIEARDHGIVVVINNALVDASSVLAAMQHTGWKAERLETPGLVRLELELDDWGKQVQTDGKELVVQQAIKIEEYFLLLATPPFRVDPLEAKILERFSAAAADEIGQVVAAYRERIPALGGLEVVMSTDVGLDLLTWIFDHESDVVFLLWEGVPSRKHVALLAKYLERTKPAGVVLRGLVEAECGTIQTTLDELEDQLGGFPGPIVLLVDYGATSVAHLEQLDSCEALVRFGAQSDVAAAVLDVAGFDAEESSVDSVLSFYLEQTALELAEIEAIAALAMVGVRIVSKSHVPDSLWAAIGESASTMDRRSQIAALFPSSGLAQQEPSQSQTIAKLAVVLQSFIRSVLKDHTRPAEAVARVFSRCADFDARLVTELVNSCGDDVVSWSVGQNDVTSALVLLRSVGRHLSPQDREAILERAASVLAVSIGFKSPKAASEALIELSELAAGSEGAAVVREAIDELAVAAFDGRFSPKARMAFRQSLLRSPRFGEVLREEHVTKALEAGSQKSATLLDALLAVQLARYEAARFGRDELLEANSVEWAVELLEFSSEPESLEDWCLTRALDNELGRRDTLRERLPRRLIEASTLHQVASSILILEGAGLGKIAAQVWRCSCPSWVANTTTRRATGSLRLVRTVAQRLGTKQLAIGLNSRMPSGQTLFEVFLDEAARVDRSMGLAVRLLGPMIEQDIHSTKGAAEVVASFRAKYSDFEIEAALQANPWRTVFSALVSLVALCPIESLSNAVKVALEQRIRSSLVRTGHRGDELRLIMKLIDTGDIDDDMVIELGERATGGLVRCMRDARDDRACISAHRFSRLVSPSSADEFSRRVGDERHIAANSLIASRPEIAISLLNEFADTLHSVTGSRPTAPVLEGFLPSGFAEELPFRIRGAGSVDSAWRTLAACRSTTQWLGLHGTSSERVNLEIASRLERMPNQALRFLRELQHLGPDRSEPVRIYFSGSGEFRAALAASRNKSVFARAAIERDLIDTAISDAPLMLQTDEVAATLGSASNPKGVSDLLDWLAASAGVENASAVVAGVVDEVWSRKVRLGTGSFNVRSEASLIQRLVALGQPNVALGLTDSLLSHRTARARFMVGELCGLLYSVEVATSDFSDRLVVLLDRAANSVGTDPVNDGRRSNVEDLADYWFARYLITGAAPEEGGPIAASDGSCDNLDTWRNFQMAVIGLRPDRAAQAFGLLKKRFIEGDGQPALGLLGGAIRAQLLFPDRTGLDTRDIAEMLALFRGSWFQVEIARGLTQLPSQRKVLVAS